MKTLIATIVVAVLAVSVASWQTLNNHRLSQQINELQQTRAVQATQIDQLDRNLANAGTYMNRLSNALQEALEVARSCPDALH